MKRDYQRLDWFTFGKQLLTTGDLDPLYIVLNKANMPFTKLCNWLMAYWCFYSTGGACYIVDYAADKHYSLYESMVFYNLAINPILPRGHERRHFRGHAASKSIYGLQAAGKPEDIICGWVRPSLDFGSIAARIQQLYLFGPWIAWKICDMLERVMGYPINFNEATLDIYSEPVKGAALIKHGEQGHDISDEDLTAVVDSMKVIYQDFKVPPLYDRSVNVQEVETILCKYKAHINGFYPLWNDTIEIIESLEYFNRTSSTAIQLLPIAQNILSKEVSLNG